MRLAYNHPKLNFHIGDLRWSESILDAMVGLDFVFNDAALKQGPFCVGHWQSLSCGPLSEIRWKGQVNV